MADDFWLRKPDAPRYEGADRHFRPGPVMVGIVIEEPDTPSGTYHN
jgi:hypothetical protein